MGVRCTRCRGRGKVKRRVLRPYYDPNKPGFPELREDSVVETCNHCGGTGQMSYRKVKT